MLRVSGSTATAQNGGSVTASAEMAGRLALKDVVAPLAAAEASRFTFVGGMVVYSGPRYGRMSHVGEMWRDMASMGQTIWLVPSPIYSADRLRPVDRDAVDAERSGRVFRVVPSNGPGRVPIGLQPPTSTGRATFGQTVASAGGVHVAYLTALDALPAPRRVREGTPAALSVFRQAKTSETLVHEVIVHAIALLAGRTDHYDGFSEAVRTDPNEWGRYRSPLRPGDFGLPALLRDANVAHLARGPALQREAYRGVTDPRSLGENMGQFGPSYHHHMQQIAFLEARRLQLRGGP